MMELLFIGRVGTGEIILLGLIALIPIFLVLLICGAFTTFPPDPQTLDRKEWAPKAHKIWNGVILYSLAGIVGSIWSTFDKLNDLKSLFSSSSPEDLFNNWLESNVDILSGATIANILVIIGFILYYVGLEEFSGIQKDPMTADRIRSIRTAAVYGIIAIVLDYIPFIGAIGSWIAELVMYVTLSSAFGYLRFSPVFNIKAKAGARLLRTAAIMYIISLFVPFIGWIFSGLGFLMTWIGWGRIANGGPIAATNTTVYQTNNIYAPTVVPMPGTPSVAPVTPPSRDTVYCPHCGTPSKEYQRFCSRCGYELPTYKQQEEPIPAFMENRPTPVIEPKPEVKTVPEPAPQPVPKPEPTPKPEPEQKVVETSSSTTPVTSKSYAKLIWGISITVIVIVAAALVYELWYRPYAIERDAPRYYTFTNLNLRTTKDADSNSNILTMLPYGTEVITYDKGYLWATIKANGAKGFVSSKHLITKEDFVLLNDVWGNEDAKKCLGATRYRLAVLDYLKRNHYTSGSSGWQIYANPYGSSLNTVVYPRMCTPRSDFEDLVFIITNNQTNERKLVVYRFENKTEDPIFAKDISIRGDLKIRKISGVREPIYSNTVVVTVYFDNNSYRYFDVNL